MTVDNDNVKPMTVAKQYLHYINRDVVGYKILLKSIPDKNKKKEIKNRINNEFKESIKPAKIPKFY